jgi:hypothetical protein
VGQSHLTNKKENTYMNIIQIKRGAYNNWVSTGTVLSSGELGLDLTNKIIKVGNGSDTWNNLPIFNTNISGVFSASSGIFQNLEINNPQSDLAFSANNNFGLPIFSISKSGAANINGLLNATSGNFTTMHISSGDIDTLKINNFYHQNLAIATGVAGSDLMLVIVDPTGSPTTEVIQGDVLRSSLLNQPAQLQFRQGAEVERLLITPASGEPIWTTDTQKFYIGNGSTIGGDFIGPSVYDRGVGASSVVVLNSGCKAIGGNSTVVGGINNLALSERSFIGGGRRNTAAQKARRANSITSVTNTITVLDAIAADFDNTTANALNITYFVFGSGDFNISRTVSTATQSGNNVILVLTSNVGEVSSGGSPITWSNVTVVNTAETDSSIGQVVNGDNNLCNGTFSVIGGGSNHTNTGSFGTVGGGDTNIVISSRGTIPGGFQAKATRYGELSHSAGRFSQGGDAQHTILIARRTTFNATANQVLFLDGSSARLTLPPKTNWTFEIKLSAYNDTDNAGAGWIYRGAIKHDGSDNTTLVGSLIEENWKETAMDSTSVSVVADNTNKALEIRVTGLTGKNIRWVAVVDISQVSYGTP